MENLGNFGRLGYPKRRKKPKSEPLSVDTAVNLLRRIENKTAKALFAFLYLTGARISEAKEFMPAHIKTITKDYAEVRVLTLKKRGAKPFRVVVIPLNEKYAKRKEPLFWKVFYSYVKDLQPFSKPFDLWGNMSEWLKRKVGKIEVLAQLPDGRLVKREKWFNPHLLRHTFCTHLADIYNATEQKLRAITGWADTRPASTYVTIRDVKSIFFPKQL